MTDSLRELDCQIADTLKAIPVLVRDEQGRTPHQGDHAWLADPANYPHFTTCRSGKPPLMLWTAPDTDGTWWKPSEDIAQAMFVIERMYKEHQLSCRIAYANDQQVAVAFYTAAGAQYILAEKMNVKGWDTSETVTLAICRAALQAKITLDGLKEIEDAQRPC